MTDIEKLVHDLEEGQELRHKIPGDDINIVIYPPEDEEGYEHEPSAVIRIGGAGGNVLHFDFVDSEAAAHFYLGFCGIKEVVEM